MGTMVYDKTNCRRIGVSGVAEDSVQDALRTWENEANTWVLSSFARCFFLFKKKRIRLALNYVQACHI